MKNKTKDYNSVDWNEVFAEDAKSPSGIVWKVSPNKSIKVSSVAGYIMVNKQPSHRYFRVMFNGNSWLVHRILWGMRHGFIDNDLSIDHIDGDSLNNSIDNMRLVSRTINQRNKKQHTNNSTGISGVSFWISRNGTTHTRAHWYDLHGKQRHKSFSCNKFGLLPAFAAACAYREKMIAELNKEGAGYTERHGLCD